MQITKKLVQTYLNYCRCQKQLSPQTLKAYRIDLTQFIRFMENTDRELNRKNLNSYISSLHEQYQPKSVRRKLTSLRALCNYLVYEDILDVSPFTKVKTKFREPLLLPKTIPLSTVEQLFSAAYTQLEGANKTSYHYRAVLRDIAVLELLFATGIRVSELCSLGPEDINFKEGSLRVYGKGSKERILYIGNKNVLTALSKYEQVFYEDIRRARYFFINQRKAQLSDQSVRLMIRRYASLANINMHITPHIFRHSFATLLLEADVDIRYIQQFLGHSSIMTTQIYTHVTTEKQKNILQKKHPRNELHINI